VCHINIFLARVFNVDNETNNKKNAKKLVAAKELAIKTEVRNASLADKLRQNLKRRKRKE
jgi:hypothetical protein